MRCRQWHNANKIITCCLLDWLNQSTILILLRLFDCLRIDPLPKKHSSFFEPISAHVLDRYPVGGDTSRMSHIQYASTWWVINFTRSANQLSHVNNATQQFDILLIRFVCFFLLFFVSQEVIFSSASSYAHTLIDNYHRSKSCSKQ